MRFSVVVAIYNNSKTIGRLLGSLKEQTFKDFEVLFCDDGSTDGTQEIVREAMKDSEIPHQYFWWKNKGMRLAASVNRGFRAAVGDQCVLITADSFPEKNYLETFAEAISVDDVGCGIRANIDEDRLVEMDWRMRKNRIPEMNAVLPVKPWEVITGNGMVIPTEAMRLYGYWDENIKGYGGDDNEICARLYYKGYVVWHVSGAVLYHNYHKSLDDAPGNSSYVGKLYAKYAS